MSAHEIASQARTWLDRFTKEHGRSPRILHIGNIANNAYNNAKFLNKIGLDCDVICYDYYHIMGAPEWEDADICTSHLDHFKPDWTSMALGTFNRPLWFAQGPLILCIDYLISRRKEKKLTSSILWSELCKHNGTRDKGGYSHTSSYLWRLFTKVRLRFYRFHYLLHVLTWDPSIADKIYGYARKGFDLTKVTDNTFVVAKIIMLGIAVLLLRLIAFPYWMLQRFRLQWTSNTPDTVRNNGLPYTSSEYFDFRSVEIVKKFGEAFPERSDHLSRQELEPYRHVLHRWAQLFEHYDVIQAYATDPILPLLAGKRPYIGFEHGTLRTFTMEDSTVCRLTALSYNQADHVFITNGDCLDYANRIGVRSYSPMLHPIDEERISEISGDYQSIHDELGVRYVFLCTLRHDWNIKGTDQYIRALPLILQNIGTSFALLMTTWGSQLNESRLLAKDLGVERYIRWIDPLPKRRLIGLQKSVDILFDQIALPHFGATAPEAIAAGVPVIMSYEPASTEWIVQEPAPILSAWNPEQIANQVVVALDEKWRAQYAKRAHEWISRHHSSRIITECHLSAYKSLLESRQNPESSPTN